jgi:hypothetical protein
MPTYKTPGVYIEEISKFPPSVVPVETAIPAFIGYTEKAEDASDVSLTSVPTRITSLLEYEQLFGKAAVKSLSVKVEQSQQGAIKATFETPPELPSTYLYYSMQLFYANGGGPCYVISIGKDDTTPAAAHFTAAITGLEGFDEPTLLVFPDACLLDDTQHGSVVGAALKHCEKMQDRFTIADVRDALPGKTDTGADVTNNFRAKVPPDLIYVKYGAAYFPYLRTDLPFLTGDDKITIASHKIEQADGTFADGTITAGTTLKALAAPPAGTDPRTDVYNAVKRLVATATVTLPPSGGIAGVYARVDRARGVWKAPANVGLLNVLEPAIVVTNDINDGLNVDPTSGKSVNAIRAFTGKGTLVWGARTLAGNDNENRYVPVRRFLIFAEESIKKATAYFVFEPNDANTWVKVRSMIESFLTRQWRDGALAGAKPEHAFYVAVGLNQTMSAQDILDGYMIVEVGLAIVRPAEFIVLKFSQKMQES